MDETPEQRRARLLGEDLTLDQRAARERTELRKKLRGAAGFAVFFGWLFVVAGLLLLVIGVGAFLFGNGRHAIEAFRAAAVGALGAISLVVGRATRMWLALSEAK